VTAHAYDVAEFAEPHDQAAEDEADRLQGIASDELDNAVLPLIWARATTAAGLLAKVKALKIANPVDDEELVLKIEKALEVEGVWDPDATLYSLIRDLVALAEEDA
jgi:hypothetical protein